ncbi:MAG TPA: nuclear transport factor 2 family protein [Thermoleophilaceae bacterium]|nr:nuclear transport factor 2 family protein [Thermoleophilaceae bacterium]
MSTELRASDPAETRDRLRDAMQRRDLPAAVATFAPDVILHSPILGGPPFEGPQAVGDLLGAVMTNFDDYTYTAVSGSGDMQMLAFHARVRGHDVDVVDLLRMDGAGRVREITVHIRPMAGLAHVAAALGPHLARGPLHRILITAFSRPLALLLSLAEPLVPRLIRTR